VGTREVFDCLPCTLEPFAESSGFDVERSQLKDLARAAEFVREITGVDKIEAYFARRFDASRGP